LLANVEKSRASSLPARLGLKKKGFVYVTLHRPSNVDNDAALRTIVGEFKRLAEELTVVFPIHPRTRKMCEQFKIPLDEIAGLKLLEPIGYHDSLWLTENARLVLTDSGGLQEESTYFRTPCLTLRPNTERPVTITLGSNKLTNLERLRADLHEVLSRETEMGTIPPFWDGKASERIIRSLIEHH
jgi:UDP-N-acetylglucosamine 2-epimerase (non-hydrolysing)